MLEAAVEERLATEGRQLGREVTEHILTCFRSWDPSISLDPVLKGPVLEREEGARAGVQDVIDAVVQQF